MVWQTWKAVSPWRTEEDVTDGDSRNRGMRNRVVQFLEGFGAPVRIRGLTLDLPKWRSSASRERYIWNLGYRPLYPDADAH